MKRLLSTLALLPLAGCALFARAVEPEYSIDARTAGPLILDVADTHDAYVASDADLVEAERRQMLRSTEILREMVENAGPGGDE